MSTAPSRIGQDADGRSYRYYPLVMAMFVTVLLCSNLIGPGKSCVVHIFGWALIFGAGNLFFPISYIFDDVLTEVYGYAQARKVIWAGFGAMVFATVMAQVIIQAKAVGVTIVWSGLVSVIAYFIVDKTIGLRVSEEDEREGLDISSHGETAYNR